MTLPIRHVAMALHSSRSRLKMHGMFKAYFDETGDGFDPNLTVAGMAGFLAPAEAWERFEPAWSAAMLRFGLEDPFHAVDFAACRGQFEGWRDRENDRRALLAGLTDAIGMAEVMPLGVLVSVPDLRSLTEAQQAYLAQGSEDAALNMALAMCMTGASIAAWASDETQADQEQVAGVFAHNPKIGVTPTGRAERLWHRLKAKPDFPYAQRMGAYGSLTPSDAGAVQAADFFSYELRLDFEKRRANPNVRMRWALRRILGMWRKSSQPWVLYFDREYLVETIRGGSCVDRTGIDETAIYDGDAANERIKRWAADHAWRAEDEV